MSKTKYYPWTQTLMRLFPHNLILSVFTLLDRPVTWITHCRHCISVQTTANLLSRSGHHAAILPHVNLNETWTAWNLLLSSEIKNSVAVQENKKNATLECFEKFTKIQWKVISETVLWMNQAEPASPLVSDQWPEKWWGKRYSQFWNLLEALCT